jgi:hypothetical protein
MKNVAWSDLFGTPEGALLMHAIGGHDAEARERYRAWLSERGDERAELFAIEDALLLEDYAERPAAIARAEALLSKGRFVRDWWDLVTKSSPIRNCGKGPEGVRPIRFAYECPRTWETLEPTGDASARHCGTCAKLVYLCRSVEDAEAHARRGECITLSTQDWNGLRSELTSGWTGRPDPVAIWADRLFPGESSDE